jgi:hypothetical protein
MIKTNFPTIKPTLNLDFAGTKQLDPRIEFTRATAATCYNGKTFAKAEENLLLYSQEFDNIYWTKANSSVTTNTVVAPDGAATADTVLETAVSSRHGIERLNIIVPSADHVLSVYVKAAGRTFVTLALNPQASTSVWGAAIFDLSTGIVASTNATSGIAASAYIVNAGNGWYRCILNCNLGTTTSAYAFVTTATDGTTYSVDFRGTQVLVGDITKGIYAWGAQLEQRSSVTAYTPTTSQPITNYLPVLMTAPAGVARFDHNPVTGESLGLLVEGPSTNLLTYSEEFSNTAWSKDAVLTADNVVVSPDGLLHGCKIVPTTTNTSHRVYQSQSVSGSSGVHTVYVKSAGYNKIAIRDAHTTGLYTAFDLSQGTPIAGGTASTPYITSVGNGWYRCSIVIVGAPTQAISIQVLPNSYTTGSVVDAWAGDGYSGIYIWGAQLEAGAFTTSYIKTGASQVTRSIDDAKMTGANFSSWYRQDAGTFFANVNGSSLGNRFVYSVDNGTSTSGNNYMHSAFETNKHFNVVSSGNTVAQLDAGTCTANAFAKFACAYTVNDFAASLNGGSMASDPSGNLPIGLSRLLIGNAYDYAPQNNINGTIKRLAYYPARLTNAQLQALTE